MNWSLRKNDPMVLPVSVQVCTLNEEANIGPCLESIRANDPQEIVVIDGGSSDRTVEIATAAGARVLAPGRLGLGPSRQQGWRATDLPYVAFVDADDRLPRTWLTVMLEELHAGGYAALQSRLGVFEPRTWWARSWDQYFAESIRPSADVSMVGRPALFDRTALASFHEELPSLDEDTHLSRWFEVQGMRQGVGSPKALRLVEETWPENAAKWRSYGKGYRGFVEAHPDRRASLVKHVLVTIPITRSARPVLRGHITQPVFGALMAWQILRGWSSPPRS